MGRRARRRDREQMAQSRTEVEEQAEELTAETDEARAGYDAEYAAYIDSLTRISSEGKPSTRSASRRGDSRTGRVHGGRKGKGHRLAFRP